MTSDTIILTVFRFSTTISREKTYLNNSQNVQKKTKTCQAFYRFTTCSQNLLRNSMRIKTVNRQGSIGRYPATPLCYMESCQKLENGIGYIIVNTGQNIIINNI